ncbi:(R)-mandelonitrile lyase [Klebsiella variicola]|uniref:(R)-mandelonitrile lyase n=1 Tax=Klebsiella variicola TaxID=244366 RepID=UPI0012DF5940|nr:cupin domain-containing protein [Klebsiella variicola]MUM47854.1 cupin domain-containing protein [Klebsiella variicola]MUM57030.1 cupin domain-containing protein [Klebsiella variicola]HCT7442788.1 cupin domain-containing protein [Klebsiella variicola]
MKAIIAAAAMSVLGATQVFAESIEIRRNGQTPSVVGKADNFSGHAVVSPLLPPNESTRASLGQVDFAPGARTAWHTHPAGQLLIVTAGKGWIQEEGKARQDIAPGDVVRIPATVRHWHGATATSPMSHLAMTYMVDGKNVDWQEPVSDEQYQ